ncbi:arginyltransferase [Acidihalobacter ferrooxydans]|uniref:arginyltransferase n=1 Tax=Acidihalobacter ferrooxydans TaxID=1765967 RepID=UPI0012EB9278
MDVHALKFYVTRPHDCPYLPGRLAVDVVADPQAAIARERISELFGLGFRRSGMFVYRPECPGCQACVAARIPVAMFRASRAQRRCAARNADLVIERAVPAYTDEFFELYCRYLGVRHAGGGMDDPTPESFREFLCTPGVESEFLLFRDAGRLVCVAVTDVLDNGLSANYTFFDPDATARSLGTFAILTQIAHARRSGYDYVYLGYWIAEAEKMRYKSRFRPLELYRDGRWWVWPAGVAEPPVT